MKLFVLISMLFAGNVFAANGAVTCTLTQVANNKSTVVGEVTLVANSHGTVEGSGYSLLTYASPVCESQKPCTGYRLTSILTKGEARLVIKGEYTNEGTGKVIAGELVTDEDSAVASCTVL